MQDYGPLLLCNESSLSSINTKISPSQRSGMDRFRANLVLTPLHHHSNATSMAWIEDHVRTWRIGNTVFKHMAPCIRCLQPTVDQV